MTAPITSSSGNLIFDTDEGRSWVASLRKDADKASKQLSRCDRVRPDGQLWERIAEQEAG